MGNPRKVDVTRINTLNMGQLLRSDGRAATCAGRVSDHEREVDVVDAGSVVERAVVARLRDVEERVSGPQQRPDDHVRSTAIRLQPPFYKWKGQNVILVVTHIHTHTHTRLTALFRDYPGEPIPER